MANTSTTELDLLKTVTTSGGPTDTLNVVGTVTTNQGGTWNTGGTLASGTLTYTNGSGSTVIDVTGYTTLTLSVRGTFTGSVTWTGGLDPTGLNGLALNAMNTTLLDGNVYLQHSSGSSNFGYKLNVSGIKYVKLTNTVVTGSLTIEYGASLGTSLVEGVNATQFVAQSGTWNIGNITGTVSIPTGASTSANQTTINTSINTLLKPASTLAAVTTVGSITNPLPAGTNVLGHIITDTGSVTNATLAAETTKVIGTVNVSSGQAITANAGTNLNTSLLALDSTLTGGSLQAKITDGTNIAAVKAASTPAAAVDKALVVAISPNNSVPVTGTFWQATQPVSGTVSVTALPTGTNSIGTVQPGNTQNTTAWLVNDSSNSNTSTTDTGTKTASFAGATQVNPSARGAIITVLCGAVSGTTPTLNAALQWSPDGGTTWLNMCASSGNVTTTNDTLSIWVYPTNMSVAGATPAGLVTGAVITQFINAPLPKSWRLNYTIGGTTPSFAISSVRVNYLK